MKQFLHQILSESNHDVYRQGMRLYNDNQVQIRSAGSTRALVQVKDEGFFSVQFEASAENEKTVRCNCTLERPCRHIVASCLELQKLEEEAASEKAEKIRARRHLSGLPSWKQYLKSIHTEAMRSGERQFTYKLLFVLQTGPMYWTLTPVIRFRKKTGGFGREIEVTDSSLRRKEVECTSNEMHAIYLMRGHDDRFRYGDDAGVLLSLLTNSLIFDDHDLVRQIQVYERKISPRFIIEHHNNFFKVQAALYDEGHKVNELSGGFHVLAADRPVILSEHCLYILRKPFNAFALIPFSEEGFDLEIPPKEFPQFLEEVYPLWSAGSQVEMPDDLEITTVHELSGKRIYLSEQHGGLAVTLRFTYGDPAIEVPAVPFNSEQFLFQKNTYFRLQRQYRVEQMWLTMLPEFGLKQEAGYFVLDEKRQTLDWIFDTVPQLAARGFEIYGEKKLKKFRVNRGKSRLSTTIASGVDWFDLKVQLEYGEARARVKDIIRALRSNSKYVKLSDGSSARIDHELLEKIGFIQQLAGAADEPDVLRINRAQTGALDNLLPLVDELKTDHTFKTYVKQLSNFDHIKNQPVPKSFIGELRPYQQHGLDWLHFLNEYHLGGCLADDMGLGKTIQALALLCAVQKKNSPATLIVAPTSVVYNWEREISRFTPQFKTQIHMGKTRSINVNQFDRADILITSYALLWRDFKLFSGYEFNYAILDESQKIKNPHSLTARCARGLKARHRLALTGTPIENNTSELWSQMTFLNPGMLGNLSMFNAYFSQAIEKENDDPTIHRLQKIIFPFILRRKKEQVVNDLPPKIESTIRCSMDARQEELYNRWREYYREYLSSQIEKEGLPKARFHVLEALTRLRQISIDPRLVDGRLKHGSPKFDLLLDRLQELSSEGHKALVFSQFVKMLHLVREGLDSAGVKYAYLDGKTRHRQAVIDKFQEDEDVRLFLISLKAGGTGLNLTAADYVIHVDPWWNPAVEMQATDRAHRIGQTKKVMVYKLVTRETVEEKILELQDKKQQLADQIVQSESGFFKSLSGADITSLFT